MRTHPPRPNLVLALTCLLAILLFFLDVAVPQAHLWGSFLLPIVLVFLWGRRRDIYFVTALASVLLVAAYWIGGIATGGEFLANELLPILVLWGVAWLLTQRRQQQEELNWEVKTRTAELGASEERYLTLFNQAGDGIFSVDAAGRYVEVNERYCRMMGRTRAEIVGAHLNDMTVGITPDFFAAVGEEIAQYGTATFERLLRHKDGTFPEVEVTVAPLNVGRMAIVHDIAQRKAAEQTLRTSEEQLRDGEERFRLIVENSPDVIALFDEQGTMVYVSPAFAPTHGTSPERALAADPRLLDAINTPPGNGPRAGELARERARPQFASRRVAAEAVAYCLVHPGTKHRVEISSPLPSGEVKYFDTAYQAYRRAGGGLQVVSIARDITERRRLEDALAESERRYRDLYDNSPDMYFVGLPAQGLLLDCNQTLARTLGYACEEIVGGPSSVLFTPASYAQLQGTREALWSAGKYDNFEAQLRCRDGTRLDALMSVTLELDAAGGPPRARVTLHDITARKRAEVALAAGEARLRAVIENTKDSIWSVDANYCFLVGNTAFVGRAQQQIGRPLAVGDSVLDEPFPPTVRAFWQPHYDRALAGESFMFETPSGLHPGGTLAIYLNPIYAPDGTVAGVTGRSADITVIKEVEAQLRESQARYQMLADHATDVIWSMNPAGKVSYVSPSSVRQSGFSTEETMCQTLEEAVAPSSRTAVRAAVGELYRLIRSGLPVPLSPNVYEMLRKDGTTYWGETIYNVVYNEQGEFQQLVGATREVTKRIHAEAQLRTAYQRVQMAADAAGLGIWNWNFADDILEWDDRMYELYAVPTSARKNGLCYDVWRSQLHPDDLAAAESVFLAALRDGSPVKIQFRIVLPDGAVRHIQAASVIEYNYTGAPVRMVGVNHDITDQVLHEQLLQDTNAVLGQRVAERTADLQAALTELQRAGKLKDEFLAMISHELRTPLTGVLSLSEMLEDQIAGPLNTRQSFYVKGITQSGERLLTVINGILGYTHLLSGKVRLEAQPCDLTYLLGTCAASQQYKAAEKHQAIAVQVTPPGLAITVDATALAEVLKRLLDNAVKFTPDGGHMGLEAHPGIAPNKVDFVVWDTGIGIAPDQVDYVFHAFTQADASLARSHEGIGLGLAYVDQMVHLMGGTLALESTPGSGTRFTITLPASN